MPFATQLITDCYSYLLSDTDISRPLCFANKSIYTNLFLKLTF